MYAPKTSSCRITKFLEQKPRDQERDLIKSCTEQLRKARLIILHLIILPLSPRGSCQTLIISSMKKISSFGKNNIFWKLYYVHLTFLRLSFLMHKLVAHGKKCFTFCNRKKWQPWGLDIFQIGRPLRRRNLFREPPCMSVLLVFYAWVS